MAGRLGRGVLLHRGGAGERPVLRLLLLGGGLSLAPEAALEVADGAAQRRAELWQPRRSEQEQQHAHNQQDFRHLETHRTTPRKSAGGAYRSGPCPASELRSPSRMQGRCAGEFPGKRAREREEQRGAARAGLHPHTAAVDLDLLEGQVDAQCVLQLFLPEGALLPLEHLLRLFLGQGLALALHLDADPRVSGHGPHEDPLPGLGPAQLIQHEGLHGVLDAPPVDVHQGQGQGRLQLQRHPGHPGRRLVPLDRGGKQGFERLRLLLEGQRVQIRPAGVEEVLGEGQGPIRVAQDGLHAPVDFGLQGNAAVEEQGRVGADVGQCASQIVRGQGQVAHPLVRHLWSLLPDEPGGDPPRPVLQHLFGHPELSPLPLPAVRHARTGLETGRRHQIARRFDEGRKGLQLQVLQQQPAQQPRGALAWNQHEPRGLPRPIFHSLVPLTHLASRARFNESRERVGSDCRFCNVPARPWGQTRFY
ncbi:hypothetical protein STIAU_7205 [Stigmatella aurantiaca DW4/3-1]|uniref:Uncharacterized protein n=1 Tax=Stigmatella aurantiaca (strain DW4/3-1) TaxID=378806 RepID=Q08SS5_STIAD|nr:hypothetical protein STIAU_7205 [Stigmatella aurantiaca DW4/3-1]